MKVAIFFGSKSDIDVMKGAGNALKEFGIPYNAYILSAHRVPEKLIETLEKIEKEGCEVIIAGAGLAAHLPGVIASHTILPIIGVPVRAAVEGMDALLSIVQMPKGIPVATVTIDLGLNAALLALQIMTLKYPKLKEDLKSYREEMAQKVLEDDKNLRG